MNRLHARHLGNISGTMMECDLEIALSLERRRLSGPVVFSSFFPPPSSFSVFVVLSSLITLT